MAVESNFRSMTKLKELEDAVRLSELNDQRLHTEHFTVLCINRYITDPEFVKQTAIRTDHAVDAYDIILADTESKRKFILSNKLNLLVQQNKLQVGCTLTLTNCRVRFDEADLQAESVIIIEDLCIKGSKSSEDCSDSYDLPWYPVSNVRQTSNTPLASGRGCYVNVWTTSDVVIPEKIQSAPSQNDIEDLSTLDLCCINELATRWGRIQSTKPPVLVRVVRKSRLLHYAKPDKMEKWPFQENAYKSPKEDVYSIDLKPLQHHFLVCDKSGYCTVVLWNVVSLKYLKQIKEGTILMLRNFTVKKSFSVNHQWHLVDNDLDIYPIDLNLNAHHPVGEIVILNNRSLPRQLRLTELKHHFVTRNQLSSVPDNVVCDVAGVVVFVGRVEREAMKSKTRGDSGSFWLRRWVHIQDHTHEKPFILQIYRGQDQVFDSLKPYQVMMCRHVRVKHNLESLNKSRQNRYVYLTTTALSHCVTLQQPLSPTVRAWMINVSRRLTDPETQPDMCVGGYFTYPPLSHNTQEFKSQHPNITEKMHNSRPRKTYTLQITPCSGWREVIETTSYRQHIRLYVQAKLAALKFHGLDKRLVHARTKKKMKVEPLEAVVNTETHENLEHFDSIGYKEAIDCHLGPVEYSRGDKLTWLNLPSLDDPKPELNGSPANQETEDVIVMTWQGLNSRVLLHTVKPVSHVSLPRRPDFHSFVCGMYDSESSEDDGSLSVQSVRDLLQSAHQYASDRFLLVLDLCRDSHTHVEVILNRAFVL